MTTHRVITLRQREGMAPLAVAKAFLLMTCANKDVVVRLECKTEAFAKEVTAHVRAIVEKYKAAEVN